nr:hypothetical protein [Tanacetum cinerariifolium]
MPPNRTVVTTTPTTDAQIKALIAQEVATALAEYETTRSRNSGNNHDSGTGVRRQSPTTRECTYNDFLKCQPMNIKGTEGVVGLTQWLKRWNLYSILGTAQSHEMVTQEKDKNKAKNDKTEHKMDKIEKDKVIRSRKVKSQSPRSTKVNPEKVKVNLDKAEAKK